MKKSEVNKIFLPPKGTEILCRNLVETTFDMLSEENIRNFKDRLLDMTGCIFGGAIVPEDQFFYQLLRRWGGLEQAPLFTTAGRLPVVSAVIHNCVLARANDFGNMAFSVFGEHIASHFGETLIPMGLTLADIYGTSGKDFITHNIAAEDTIARVLYAMPARWPLDMLLVSSAAAALAARYYKLSAGQAKVALSYAAVNAIEPGNSYFDYCQNYKLHNGECARLGIMAAEIAAGGWRGLEDPFFGHWGLISRMLGDEDELPALYEKAFAKLGAVYFTEYCFKRFPGGLPTTAVAQCGAAIHERIIAEDGVLDPEKIRNVHVYRSNSMRKNSYYNNPFKLRNHTNALFSYRFSACCALVHGTISVRHVQTPAIQANPLLVELAENATMNTFDCEPGKMMVKVVVEMKDGRVFEEIRDYNQAMFEYPSKEFIERKFWDQFNAFGKLPKSVGEKIIELAGRIETLTDMREYTELLTLKS
ncbi:MAG: MmgE/PrpD family protein [Firmicutes bacterium]|nr:MmgE/PrpD family protein [Bacillota bacterium]